MELAAPNGASLPRILGPRMQIGLVVRDIDEATSFWGEQMGVGPWIVIDSPGGSRRIVHRGEEIDVDMVIAFSYTGETQLEIICQINETPSLYTEFLDSGRQGMHHLGFWPEDFDGARAALESCGFSEITAFYLADGTRNVSYYESPVFVGAYLEVAPMTPFRKSYMGAIERLSLAWDGSRPIRRFGSREEFVASDDYQRVVT